MIMQMKTLIIEIQATTMKVNQELEGDRLHDEIKMGDSLLKQWLEFKIQMTLMHKLPQVEMQMAFLKIQNKGILNLKTPISMVRKKTTS